MCDETYHGWPNRETWAFHLWLTNEQATDAEARRVVNNAYTCVDGADTAGRFVAGEALRVWWHDTLDAARENGYRETFDAMRDDVGSLWRVDWQAVAAALLDDEPNDARPVGGRCGVCAHPERLHDERVRAGGGKAPCSTCSVCAAAPEYECPQCHAPGMVLPFSAHTAVNAAGEITRTREHTEWSDDDDAECAACGFSGDARDFSSGRAR